MDLQERSELDAPKKEIGSGTKFLGVRSNEVFGYCIRRSQEVRQGVKNAS